MTSAVTQADLQRGFDTQAIVGKLDGINNGLCDGFYAMNTGMLQGFNGVQQGLNGVTNAMQQGFNNTNVALMQGQNALATQLADCCCKTQTAIRVLLFMAFCVAQKPCCIWFRVSHSWVAML